MLELSSSIVARVDVVVMATCKPVDAALISVISAVEIAQTHKIDCVCVTRIGLNLVGRIATGSGNNEHMCDARSIAPR